MKKILLIFTAVFCAWTADAQNKRAWEIGIGGSAYQFNRVGDVRFTPSADKHIVDVKLRHAVYGGNLYAAKELSDVFALDFQGSLGKIEKEWLAHAGLGLQWRFAHYFRSPYIDPYIRVGAGYMYKGYDILYRGEQDGVDWGMSNDHNKEGRDARHIIPVTAGVGINMWLNDRAGIGLQGDYLYMPEKNVADALQGTVRIIFRFGGKSKKPAPIVSYVDRPVERIVERPVEVERVVEKVVEVEKAVSIDRILQNIHFDYDSSTLKTEYLDMVRDIAGILLKDTGKRYLITGFTDARGNSEYNLRLSGRRAAAIRDALVNMGVPGYMLKARGAGMGISHVPAVASDDVREGDRKATIEPVTNMEYWERL